MIHRVLAALRVKLSQRSRSTRAKYIALRRISRLFGLYPKIHGKHLFYENPNSFMAPKIYEYVNMMKMTCLQKTDTVLDLGCGEGTLTFILGNSVAKVIGVDIGEQGICDARFKAKEIEDIVDAVFHCQKIEELGLQEGSIDKVFSFSVIEHIPNYLEVFEELFRIIKPGGELVISVDSFTEMSPELKSIHQAKFDVKKYFNKNELEVLLRSLGFEDVEIKPIFKSKFSENWFIRVMKNPDEYFGTFKRLYSFLVLFKIMRHERKIIQNENGIFLLARCVKPVDLSPETSHVPV